jgi:hypothetical protein
MQVRRRSAVTLAIAGALGGGAVAWTAPAALAGSDQATMQTHPSVRPRIGRRHSTFELAFTLAQAPGRAGFVDTYYREAVSPPAHAAAECSPAQPTPVFSGSQGATVKISLRPSAHGWCKGRYDVTVFLQRTNVCGPPVVGRALSICPVIADAQPVVPIPEVNTGETHFTVR